MRPTGPGGLLLGYAGLSPREIRDGVDRLATALDRRRSARPGV
jgi:DNA-binding transcriptional MocR family regulator